MADAKTYAERSSGAWHGVSWPMLLPPLTLLGWPAAYLLATAKRQTTSDIEHDFDFRQLS